MRGILERLVRRKPSTDSGPAVALTYEQAQHCQQALAWLATNFLFADVFGPAFVPAAETLAKLVRATEPEKDKIVTRFLAEADQSAAELAQIRSQHQ